MELYVLIQSSKEVLPILAEMMHRTYDEIASKYERVHEAFNIQYMEQAKRYVNGGNEEDEAFLRASKEKINIKAYSLDQIRKEYPKAYAKWTQLEENQLAELFHKKTINELADIHQRQPGAIRSRLRKPGLIEY